MGIPYILLILFYDSIYLISIDDTMVLSHSHLLGRILRSQIRLGISFPLGVDLYLLSHLDGLHLPLSLPHPKRCTPTES